MVILLQFPRGKVARRRREAIMEIVKSAPRAAKTAKGRIVMALSIILILLLAMLVTLLEVAVISAV
jgi:hypothetical protein